MSRMRNTPLLLALVICIMVVAGTMVAAIFLASQKPVVVVVPAAPPPVAVASVAAGPEAQALPAAAPGPVQALTSGRPVEIVALRVPVVPALNDALDADWNVAPAVEVPLQPQQTAAPMLDAATVRVVAVQALRDDKRIAWRLSWPAPKPATRVESAEFSDAVAIQLPMADGAPFTMGAKGTPVRLLLWKALWQRDLDEGFQDVHKLYPNAVSDLYWFAQGKAPYPLEDSFKDPRSHQFMPALAAGNPMADFQRKAPLEEIAAEGFGSATHLPATPSRAKGQWKEGRWTVVIDRPLDPQEPLIARLQSSTANLVSFAVWDGSAQNRGGRKHYCTWVPLRIEP